MKTFKYPLLIFHMMIENLHEKETQAQFEPADQKQRNEDPIQEMLRLIQARQLPPGEQLNLLKWIEREIKKYSQDWPAYDKAKTEEAPYFFALLLELLSVVIQEPKHTKGRRPYPLAVQILCIMIKIYFKCFYYILSIYYFGKCEKINRLVSADIQSGVFSGTKNSRK